MEDGEKEREWREMSPSERLVMNVPAEREIARDEREREVCSPVSVKREEETDRHVLSVCDPEMDVERVNVEASWADE